MTSDGMRESRCLVALCSPAAWSGPTTCAPRSTRRRRTADEPKDAADTANTEWWKQFDDPVLDSLIAEALANNKNVKIAAANVEQAAGVLTQTRSALFPQVGLQRQRDAQRSDRTGETPCCRTDPQSAPRPTRCSPARAGRSTSGAASGGSPKRRGPTCSRPRGAARRDPFARVARSPAPTSSSAASTSSSRSPSDARARTASRCKLFELQFKYGQRFPDECRAGAVAI